MNGGGDTPSQQTLVAVLQGVGAPTAWYGELRNGTFYLAAKDDGEKVSVVNVASGTVQGEYEYTQILEERVFHTVAMSYPECEDITPENVLQTTGENVPNWEDYEILDPI